MRTDGVPPPQRVPCPKKMRRLRRSLKLGWKVNQTEASRRAVEVASTRFGNLQKCYWFGVYRNGLLPYTLYLLGTWREQTAIRRACVWHAVMHSTVSEECGTYSFVSCRVFRYTLE
jgi:hypothetical protein